MSADVVDPVVAMMDIVRMSDGVSEIADGRVFGAELPESEQSLMPRASVVVSHAGIGGSGIGVHDTMRVRWSRLDVRCYGQSPSEAARLGAMIDRFLHAQHRQTVSGVVTWHVTRVAGPVGYRAAPGDWPVSVWTFDLLHAVTVLD